MPPKKRPSTSARKEAQADESKDETCFLAVQKKKKKNIAYHYAYDEESVADIPELSSEKCIEEDRDLLMLAPPEEHQEVTEEDIRLLKQELSQLPFEIILRMLFNNDYNVGKTLEECRDYEIPDLIPAAVKQYFIANIAAERLARPSRGQKYKQFYFARMFRGIVDVKELVDFYYREKNKIGNNWRQAPEEVPLSEEKQKELARNMKACNVTLIKSNVFNSSEAVSILEGDEEEEEISSENSETDEYIPHDVPGPSSRPLTRRRSTKSQPKSPSLPGCSTSSSNPTPYRSIGSPN